MRTFPIWRGCRVIRGYRVIAVLAAVAALSSSLALTAFPGPAFGAEPGGPELRVPRAELAAALQCFGPALTDTTKSPVLLSHATAVSANTNFGRNYIPALTAQGYPVCTVDYPDVSMGDIQISAEYVVYAVRHMASVSGRKVSIIAHSQGGLQPRWALRFWPDVREDTSVYVAWGTPQHGSTVVDALCLTGCAPALQQMRTNSRFLAALNSGTETWGTTAYTTVSTALDEFVQPQPSSSSLDGATNIGVQSICPGHVVDHILLTFDPVVYAITMDALSHQSAADPSRIGRAACSELVMPRATVLGTAQTVAEVTADIAVQLALQPHDFSAPPTAPYAR